MLSQISYWGPGEAGAVTVMGAEGSAFATLSPGPDSRLRDTGEGEMVGHVSRRPG